MKKALLFTTALIGVSFAAGGLSLARESAAEYYGLDANQTFLCNYGFPTTTKAFYENSSETTIGYTWTRAAVPVIGKGNPVRDIIVANAPPSLSSVGSSFSVAIYSGWKQPYHNLARAMVKPAKRCGRTEVPISAIQLEKGKKYWIVETAVRPRITWPSSSAENATTWLYDKQRTRGAVMQSGYSCYGSVCCPRHYRYCHFRHKSDWKSLSGVAPYARIK